MLELDLHFNKFEDYIILEQFLVEEEDVVEDVVLEEMVLEKIVLEEVAMMKGGNAMLNVYMKTN
ncbi:hypothetical protein DAPPUDRAFT_265576 [Daphnia pulex]|uniref:Uncharacterized protein n=1 Tax=Daphnia pulex TaxID=6669 RepID=E9HTN1_DAPPU|nr:hypothetical protein DAPPUDRAFT_265576 [Daphnia pulex]|eukprot:EFX64902.1 hypothetical protein DAPPUDRAFT_265576 [Daphnia pulex]